MKSLILSISFFFFVILNGYSSDNQQGHLDIHTKLAKPNLSQKDKVSLYIELNVYYNSKNADSSFFYAKKSFEESEKINYINGKIISMTNIGSVYFYKGDFPNALKSFITSNELTDVYIEENGFDDFSMKQMSKNLNNIALIYLNQQFYDKAEDYLLKSLDLDLKLKDQISIANSYNNLGTIKENQNKYDEALNYYLKSLKIKYAERDSLEIPSTLINIGVLKMNSDAYFEADTCFQQAIKYSEKTNNLKDLSLAQINLGDSYYLQGNFKEAIVIYLKAAIVCENQNYLNFLSYAYESIAMSYEELNNFEEAYKYYKLYVETNEKIHSEENSRVLNELQTKFETEKKEKEISLLKKDKELQDIELETSRRLLLVSIFGFVIFSVFIVYLIYSMRQKKIINKQIKLKNKKLEIAYSIVEEKQQEIIDSINYAKRIQNAILPPKKYIDKYLPENFILYQPKDIVAGDFYWLEYKDNKVLFAAADCTGHGVPGAMVSVICNNGLNRSVREHNITDPGKILDKTTEIVIQEFEKSDDEVKDGMDISLCVLENNTLHWSGANNPLFIVRNNTLIEFLSNRQPIGKFAESKPFTTHKVMLEKEDVIYVFTDGFQDQFGGEKGKKFMVKKFKELLINIATLPMSQQKQHLIDVFEKWKGENEQVDDVCIIGVRI
jgi:serine phosphatase RsbU (regulator of sigma subunit)/Tfp pilus assembly protein PilF